MIRIRRTNLALLVALALTTTATFGQAKDDYDTGWSNASKAEEPARSSAGGAAYTGASNLENKTGATQSASGATAESAQSATSAASDTSQVSSGATAGSTRSNANAQASNDPATGVAYGVLVVPFQVSTNEQLNSGCWTRLYENPDFGGSALTVVGPLDLATLDGTLAQDWNGADSIVTGPSARVMAYDEENFGERLVTVEPGTRNAEITGPFEKIESLKVSCQGQQQARAR